MKLQEKTIFGVEMIQNCGWSLQLLTVQLSSLVRIWWTVDSGSHLTSYSALGRNDSGLFFHFSRIVLISEDIDLRWDY